MSPLDLEALAAAVAGHDRVVWLDGAAAPAGQRRSVLGWPRDDDPWVAVPAGRDPFGPVADLLAGAAEGERVYGWFGYAARTDLPALIDPADPVPASWWTRCSRRVEVDHDSRAVTWHGVRPFVPAPLAEPAPPGPVSGWWSLSREAYARAFAAVQEQLRRGNSYEVNLTHRVRLAQADAPFEVYRRLRRLNPAPYAAYLRAGDTHLLSSSPERFARLADGTLETRPIKGTTPRDPDPHLDATQADRLRTDPKLRAENLIVTDLLRNDLSMVCEPGSVEVPDLMRVESYASVHQSVTTVRGRVRAGVTPLEAVHALTPAGSMTGAPKRRTMQVVADVEATPRGPYAGALGWVSADACDLAVVIRTLVAHRGTWTAGTGGGVTVASDVDDEHAEGQLKLQRLLRALGT